jgi:membrane-associated PAP2 superfamily phosphatase
MRYVKKLLIPFLVLVVCTVILESMNADIRVSALFYDPLKGGWYLGSENPWIFLYNHAHKPAYLIASCALIVLVAGLFHKGLARYKKESLFLVLLLAIGPGLVVNTLFKDHWGRPRPIKIVNFGGEADYHPAWEKGVAKKNGSFPSGHASIGFYLMAPYFFLQRRNRLLAFCFLGFGLAAGSFYGAARIIQGKHFLTDVIWAGGIIYFTGEILAIPFHFNTNGPDDTSRPEEDTDGNNVAA